MQMFTVQKNIKKFKQIPCSKQMFLWWRAISAKTMLTGDMDKMGQIVDLKKKFALYRFSSAINMLSPAAGRQYCLDRRSFLALLVSRWRCTEDISTKDYWLSNSVIDIITKVFVEQPRLHWICKLFTWCKQFGFAWLPKFKFYPGGEPRLSQLQRQRLD